MPKRARGRKSRKDSMIPHVGAPPGAFELPEEAAPSRVRLFRYDATNCERLDQPTLAAIAPSPTCFTWLDVEGLEDRRLVDRLEAEFAIHPLVLEDVINENQRSKSERYDNHDFIVLHMARLIDGQLNLEQLSIVFDSRSVVTVQAGIEGDVLEPVRARLSESARRLRSEGTAYLAYTLIDCVVDHYFPVLETLAERLLSLEDDCLDARSSTVPLELHRIERDFAQLRRSLRPLRDALTSLRTGGHVEQPLGVQPYLRDCQDHVVQLLDELEHQSQMAASYLQVFLSRNDNRLNESMRTLTVVSTVFMPLTFIVGIYGMNFDRSKTWNMPELGWEYGYPVVLGLMVLLVVAMVLYFRRVGMLGSSGVSTRR